MLITELEKQIRILKRKIARSEENRILLEEALESHIRALSVGIEELMKSHETIKASEERFRQLALYDTLTKLPNRILFFERLERSIFRAKRFRHSLAILFIDLDRFKQINDNFGHQAGDAVLQEASSRIVSSVREVDTVSRLAGDEFSVLLEMFRSRSEIEMIASRIVSSLATPMRLHSNVLEIGASIGISSYPTDGEKPDELLRKADIAMYNIKKRTGNAWQFYTD
ncbi:GGDEF domain-containing protein [Desulfovibrio sp. TomC]|uniref:GGDEF domain-containing protein n=1 Tax=Desulfovibrio sp. TomC TaxID=1562888 RepID=UPI000575A1A4|nr:GGDEF domain-containing protein [Desulfovibrio sp. TomC]KHK01880.1 diguanylate cyclase/phosphodiesterase (GGDEF & EAL domains) with PAS/PAC sensor(s) [Desulfovibrio sp. TomC]